MNPVQSLWHEPGGAKTLPWSVSLVVWKSHCQEKYGQLEILIRTMNEIRKDISILHKYLSLLNHLVTLRIYILWTRIIFLHAHPQFVYNNCVKFHHNRFISEWCSGEIWTDRYGDSYIPLKTWFNE